MADLSTAAGRLADLASNVALAWDGLREAWQDSDADRFGQTFLTEPIVLLGRLAEELTRVDDICHEARQELSEE